MLMREDSAARYARYAAGSAESCVDIELAEAMLRYAAMFAYAER